jgi:tripartite-type tricarboxylate transporter receptor subunit TctC
MRAMLSALLCLSTFAASPVLAADPAPSWPDKPVTFVVASAAGGSADVLSRIVFNQLAK